MDKKPRLGSDPLEWVKDTRKEAERTKRREMRCETRDLALLKPSSQVNASFVKSTGVNLAKYARLQAVTLKK